MVLKKTGPRLGMIAAVMMAVTLLDHTAIGQDAAWEGLINSGRNALQQGNFSEAERQFESALEAAESFPSGDARLGKSFNNLAAVYYAQEDYARAEPLMRRALAELRETLGPEDTEVAQTMKNLAALYYLQGNRGEAEALLKQALVILEQVHGPNHAFVATVLSNLAGLYQSENRYQDAEPLLTRSLAIWESLLGPDHPDVVRSRALLANVRQAERGGTPLTPALAENEVDDADEDGVPRPPDPATRPVITEANAPKPPPEPDETQAVEPAAPFAETPAPPEPASDEVAKAANALAQLVRPEGDGADAAVLPGTSGQVPQALPSDPGEETEVGDAASSALDPVTTAQSSDPATILNEATSADEVSFSIYLSTLWSVDEAMRYWVAMQTAMPGVLQNKQMEIQEVSAGDGSDPFYRVLTFPFTSDPEAQAACDEIKAQLRTHDCNVVLRDKTKTTAQAANG